MKLRTLIAAGATGAWGMGACLAGADSFVQPNYAKVDTDRWRCRLCPFELASRKQTTWTVGGIHVEDAQARFGRDSGLDEAGLHGDLGVNHRHRGDNGRTTVAHARRLALDSRALGVVVKGNRTELGLERRDLPRNISKDGLTPYTGGASLTLPGDWVAAFDTAGMSGLGEGIRFERGTVRRRTTVRLAVAPDPRWWLRADYSRETKSGTDETFADFLYRATGLAKPVEFLTEEFTTGTGLEGDSFSLAAELRHSRFRNQNRALAWQTPWRDPAVPRGRKALAPDNDARSLTLISRNTLGARVAAHATLTWSEARQDTVFERYTTNSRLAPGPLPANSLDGRARSFNGAVHLVARPTDRLRLMARHRRFERDNQTLARTFMPVLGEALTIGPTSSRAFDVERSATEFGVAYRVMPRINLGVYTEANRVQREPAEIAANEERRHRIELSARGVHGFRMKLALTDAKRGASRFRDTTSNNPLTRRYHQAAREQRTWRARVGYDIPNTGAFVEVRAECSRHAYTESVLGLQHDRTCARGGDIAYAPSNNVSVSGFYLVHESDSATFGRSGYTGGEWRYAIADGVDTAGLRLDVGALRDGRLHFSLDYVRSLGTGRYATEMKGQSLPFPDLVSNHSSVDVHAWYQLRKGSALVLQVRHERYRGADWALVDSLDAIRNVLTFGNAAPHYAVSMIGVSYEASL
ncbi:MAG: MtrB/PioB family decaheme-associated outer membrane protein [Gammaproteobacteria bacterium]|nr:MtrB/PioB family decaheme-associated outer membrane protein [Gammaproteobacteria bacterium]